MLAAQKMVQQDKIFAVDGLIGTATAHGVDADLPRQQRGRTSSRSPGAREMFEPPRQLKFSFAAPYFDQIRAGIEAPGQGEGPQEGLHALSGRRLRP